MAGSSYLPNGVSTNFLGCRCYHNETIENTDKTIPGVPPPVGKKPTRGNHQLI